MIRGPARMRGGINEKQPRARRNGVEGRAIDSDKRWGEHTQGEETGKSKKEKKNKTRNLGLPLQRQFQGTDRAIACQLVPRHVAGQRKRVRRQRWVLGSQTQVSLISSWALVRTKAQLSPSLICALPKPKAASHLFTFKLPLSHKLLQHH